MPRRKKSNKQINKPTKLTGYGLRSEGDMNVRVCCVRAVAGVCARRVGLRHLQRTARYKPNMKHKMPLSVSPAYFPTLDFYKQMRQEGLNCFNSPFTTSFDLNKYKRCCFQNIFLTSLRNALVSIFIYMTIAKCLTNGDKNRTARRLHHV